ncbi:hypothetical protein MTBSS4_210088 [Magnetospirillum sp. SS-4]|nr:hypothetical protein MTBSS4_210088 [Magnetospirillum sp. SS-4]
MVISVTSGGVQPAGQLRGGDDGAVQRIPCQRRRKIGADPWPTFAAARIGVRDRFIATTGCGGDCPDPDLTNFWFFDASNGFEEIPEWGGEEPKMYHHNPYFSTLPSSNNHLTMNEQNAK